MGGHKSDTTESVGTGNHFSEWLLFSCLEIEMKSELEVKGSCILERNKHTGRV